MFKLLILKALIIISFLEAYGQTIYVGIGEINHLNVIQTNMINPTQISRNREYYLLGLTMPLAEKVFVGFNYSEFKGWTYAYSNGINSTFGFGSSRIKLRRFGLLFNYEVDILENRFSFSPLAEITFEQNVVQQPLGRQVVNIFDGSNTFGEYKGYTEVEVFESGQVLPTLGLILKLRLIKGLHLFGTVRWSKGHKTYQDMYVHYSFLDETQPTAQISDNGTAFIRAIGISYDLNILKPLFSR